MGTIISFSSGIDQGVRVMNIAPSPQLLARADFGVVDAGPLHGQVRQFLRDTIEKYFEDGQSFWTERLLIERLGIARGTLRQALDELAREGVLVREAKRGSFVRKATVTALGLIFERADSDFYAEMTQHLAAQCIARGLRLELYPLLTGASVEKLPDEIRHQPTQERLLLMPEGLGGATNLPALLGERGYRVLSLDDVAGPGGVPFVTTDGEQAVRVALDHLQQIGHHRITFLVNEPSERPSVRRKMAEFERLVGERDLPEARIVDCDTRAGQSSFEKAYGVMPMLWDGSGQRPTAIFTASDPGAWAALRWFAECGIKVPDQVSVLGYEGVKPNAFTHPPLSTIAHDFDELARRAVDLLWASSPALESEWVAPRLVLRQSTAPPR